MTDGVQNVPIDLIDDGTRLRGTRLEQVESLASSIKEVGLISPISVYKRKVIRGGIAVEGYGLIAGLHRKEACVSLDMRVIPAQILDIGELHRQIAECDENLIGPSLSPAERAMFTRRRKEAYEALHPETRHGGDRRSNQADNLSTRSFAAETAASTGKDERTVRRDAERGEKVAPEALEYIQGTKLDTGAYLDKLKSLPRETQSEVAEQDMATERRAKTDEEIEDQIWKLVAKLSAAGRDRFFARTDAMRVGAA